MKQILKFDCIFGPAYKGISFRLQLQLHFNRGLQIFLIALIEKNQRIMVREADYWCAHSRRVLIIDDVISAGTSINESIDLSIIMRCGPQLGFVALIGRRKVAKRSAIEDLDKYKIPVLSIIT